MRILACLLLLGCGGHASETPDEREGLVWHDVREITTDAYVQWAGEHLSVACPSSIDELVPYMQRRDPRDRWRNHYQLLCGPTLPKVLKGGIALVSPGPDGKLGTDDDVRSW